VGQRAKWRAKSIHGWEDWPMGLDMLGPRSQVAIEDRDEQILGKLPDEYGLTAPQCEYIWQEFYEGPRLATAEQVKLFRGEIVAIRAEYIRRLRERLRQERNVHGPPLLAEESLDGLMKGDSVIAKCDALVNLCDEAIEADRGIRCLSD